MKAVSVRQPYAQCLFAPFGAWLTTMPFDTDYRGTVLIHAPTRRWPVQTWPAEVRYAMADRAAQAGDMTVKLPTGAIIGKADLYGTAPIVRADDYRTVDLDRALIRTPGLTWLKHDGEISTVGRQIPFSNRWDEGWHVWLFRNPVELANPVPAKGETTMPWELDYITWNRVIDELDRVPA